jgi:Spo0E like sporulation regulatory protein.
MAELTELQEMIERMRDKLNEVISGKTLTDQEVIRASQMLDVILVEYQRMIKDKTKM